MAKVDEKDSERVHSNTLDGRRNTRSPIYRDPAHRQRDAEMTGALWAVALVCILVLIVAGCEPKPTIPEPPPGVH